MARHEPRYWSVCCGAAAEYIGFYRCSDCHQRIELGTLSQGRAGQPGTPAQHEDAVPPAAHDRTQQRPTAPARRASRKSSPPPPPDQLALFTIEEAS